MHDHLREWEQAAQCYSESLTILSSLASTDPYEEADVQSNLARVRHAEGHVKEALHASDHAIHLIEIMRSPLSGEDARIGFFGTRISIYEQRIGFELDWGCPEAGLTVLERAKSRSFIELLSGKARTPVRDYATPEQASLREVDPLTTAEIQRRLPTDTLLLEYFVARDRACVFTVTPDSLAVTPLEPGLSRSIGNIFEPGQQRLLGLAPDGRGQLHEPWLLHHLYRLLLAPVADQLRARPRGLHRATRRPALRALSCTPGWRGERDALPHRRRDRPTGANLRAQARRSCLTIAAASPQAAVRAAWLSVSGPISDTRIGKLWQSMLGLAGCGAMAAVPHRRHSCEMGRTIPSCTLAATPPSLQMPRWRRGWI